MAKAKEISDRVGVRLDRSLYPHFADYARRNGLNASQAVRTLLAIALVAEQKAPDAAFRSAAFREGMTAGIRVVKQGMAEAFHAILNRLDEVGQ